MEDTLLRYELKAFYPEAVAYQLPAWVARCGFVEQHPSRWVNSMYWDSHDLSDLVATQDGDLRREKLRLRWYGLGTTVAAALELKYKDGMLSGKRRHVVTGVVQLDWPWRIVLRTSLCGARPVLQLAARRRPRPSVLVRYFRHYYALPDGGVRLTLDHQLRLFPQTFASRPNVTREAPRRMYSVLELKAGRQQASRLSYLADRLGLPWSRHSKYVLGSTVGVM